MIQTASYKSKQFLWLVFKLIILMLFGYFIYQTLTQNEQLSLLEFVAILQNSQLILWKNVLVMASLSALNWILEIEKWKLLANQIRPTSWKNSAAQSLASLTFSLITPNRIGEYGAKAIYFPKKERKRIVALNFIGNFHQLVITCLVGFAGISYWNAISKEVFSTISVMNILIVFTLITGGIILLIYTTKHWKWRKQIFEKLHFITQKLNAQISFLSLLRYLVFSHQFYWMLKILHPDISYESSMAAIASIYLISSFIPMLSLFDVVVKGSVAVFVFSFVEISPLVVLSVTTLMWVFNFVIPAMIGSYFVITFQPRES